MNNMERLFEECDEALSSASMGTTGYEKQDIAAVADGQGALALDFSKMTAKEIAVELVKIWGVDAIADASAFTAGYACDELGMPTGVSFLASMLTGCTVSVGVGGYVFTDSSGKVVKELDADEMQTWLKSIDVDLDDMTGGGGYKGIIENVEYSGEEWCRYFREVYGNDNVIWENATPSQLARSWQGTGKYSGVDNYIDVTVSKGTILYRGEPNGTEYFTSVDAIEQSGRDAVTIFEGLQVEKNPIHGYREEMQGYLFNEDIASAYGITSANPQFGKGGLPQYYVPNVQDLIDKGILTPVDKIKLYK